MCMVHCRRPAAATALALGLHLARATARACASAFLLAVACGSAGAAQDLSVQAVRRDEGVEIHAHALIDASWDTVWSTLTDFDRLAEFIPGIKSSRVIERVGNTVTVEQLGEARFLMFSFPIQVTMVSTERPPGALTVLGIKGSFRRLEGGYQLRQVAPGRIALGWTGLVQPDFPVPPLLGTVLMRASVEGQFAGMVREIERRQALRLEAKAGD